MVTKRKNRIVEMDPEHLREIDGVVFDLDSFARHCAPHPTNRPVPASIPEPADAPSVPPEPQPDADAACASVFDTPQETVPIVPQEVQHAAPAPVFQCDPVHIGWYEIRTELPAYPIMAGAVAPSGISTGMEPVFLSVPSGSGSYVSSYLSLYTTSFTTSFATSFLTSFTSSFLSSWMAGSFPVSFAGSALSSGVLLAGGYGLELI